MYFMLPSEALNLSSPKVCELELKDIKNVNKKNSCFKQIRFL